MKIKEIKEINTIEELEKKYLDLKQELFNLRFQVATGKQANTMRPRQIKRDIAKILTVICERKNQEAKNKN